MKWKISENINVTITWNSRFFIAVQIWELETPQTSFFRINEWEESTIFHVSTTRTNNNLNYSSYQWDSEELHIQFTTFKNLKIIPFSSNCNQTLQSFLNQIKVQSWNSNENRPRIFQFYGRWKFKLNKRFHNFWYFSFAHVNVIFHFIFIFPEKKFHSYCSYCRSLFKSFRIINQLTDEKFQ